MSLMTNHQNELIGEITQGEELSVCGNRNKPVNMTMKRSQIIYHCVKNSSLGLLISIMYPPQHNHKSIVRATLD